MTRTQISCWRSRRRDLVKSDLYAESPVINVIGDERAHTRNESSILAVLNNQFDRAVNFFSNKTWLQGDNTHVIRSQSSQSKNVIFLQEQISPSAS